MRDSSSTAVRISSSSGCAASHIRMLAINEEIWFSEEAVETRERSSVRSIHLSLPRAGHPRWGANGLATGAPHTCNMWARYAGSMAIAPGAQAPPVDGLTNDGPRALVFFKVTCSTTHLATPAIERLARAYPGIVFGVGQDDRAALDSFAETFGLSMPLVSDLEPYVASDAYGIESAP